MIALIVAICGLPLTASAADVFSKELPPIDSFPNHPLTVIYVEGEIKSGDLEKIKSEANGKFVAGVKFWSPGGNVAEAIAISEFLADKQIAVTAPNGPMKGIDGLPGLKSSCEEGSVRPRQSENCVCASACAIIWLLSPTRFGGRDLLGLHRPRFDHDEFAGLSLAQAKSAYNEMLSTVVEKLQENQVSESLIEKMMAT